MNTGTSVNEGSTGVAVGSKPLSLVLQDPLWYKDAIIYEVHVRAFADSNGDGIGDFPGLTGKLDYLKDLGVNTIWLLPFYPSPLKDDGYDISDYRGVHPSYGTLSEFKTFLAEAHCRGLRVITELVLNHTSDQHSWFKRAREAPEGSDWRNWYVWSPTTERYRDARIIFSDYESSNWSWDPVAKAYYWHRFYSHQPDLNYDHPPVHQAMIEVVDFWLDLGVDGFRLDAVPYLFEREGTSCENIPETHDFLRKLRAHVDARFPGRVLLAEANQWPEDAIAYFGRGDECNMAFHFPIMARMFLSVQMEDRYPMVDILAQTPPIPESAQWALFLRNHDELTLEMVTDEERDYMYRGYARDLQARFNLGIRRRLAPLLQNDRKKIELLNALLFSLPGTPVIYYGDEIGMGDNIFLGDRNGVRTPMQWSGDRNAGFSKANTQRLYLPPTVDPEYHYEAVNVEAQQANSQSLLWWMKRLLALSRHWKAFGRGTIDVLSPENRKVLAFLRQYQEETILVVANLSRFSQYVELDLSGHEGRVPVELFGRTEFPKIGKAPYLLTLGPHSFYWFALDATHAGTGTRRMPALPRRIEVEGSWEAVLEGRARTDLERALQAFLPRQPWFSPHGRRMKGLRISQTVPWPGVSSGAVLLFLEVEYFEGDPESYSFPLCFADESAESGTRTLGPDAIAELVVSGGESVRKGLLLDGLADPQGWGPLVDLLLSGKEFAAGSGRYAPLVASDLPELLDSPEKQRATSSLKASASGNTLHLGSRLALLWHRRIEAGPDADLEIVRVLRQHSPPAPILPVAGHLEFRPEAGEPVHLAVLREQAPGSTDAWTLTLEELERYFERVRSTPGLNGPGAPALPRIPWNLASDPPPLLQALIGPYLAHAQALGRSTALLHRCLVPASGAPALRAEPLGQSQQRSIYQTLRSKSMRTLVLLRRSSDAADSPRLDALGTELVFALQNLLKTRLASLRIRAHGALTLSRFVSTGSEFLLSDWSGPAGSTPAERRIKRSPLSDVAGILHSFRGAATKTLLAQLSSGENTRDQGPLLEAGAAAWYACVGARYLESYRKTLKEDASCLGPEKEGSLLLSTYLLEKSLDDLNAALLAPGTARAVVLKHVSDLLDDLRPFSSSGAPLLETWSGARDWIRFWEEPPPGQEPNPSLPQASGRAKEVPAS